jgi:hypothetical protein
MGWECVLDYTSKLIITQYGKVIDQRFVHSF